MSSSSCHSFGSTNENCLLKNDSDTDTEADRATKKQISATIPPILIQKQNRLVYKIQNNHFWKKNFRQILYQSSYQHPDFEIYSHDSEDYKPEILTGEISLVCSKNTSPRNYDYRDPELPETNSSLVTMWVIISSGVRFTKW